MTFPQCVGPPCGQHGPYTFFKAFKYFKNGKYKILTLGEFFFVRISPSDDPCIGELQLLWDDRNSDQLLSSMRLYFLPEQTPEGRQSHHGEHEVLAAAEKVILKLEDLVEWITEEVEWTHGLLGVCADDVVTPPPSPTATGADSEKGETKARAALTPVSKHGRGDAWKEKQESDKDGNLETPDVMVLSYPRYCRYRSVLKRLGEVAELWLKNALIIALGGLVLTNRNSHILFCRDTFDNEALIQNDLNCDHLAPNLKGRPRKKCIKAKRSSSPSSESNASEESKEQVAKVTNDVNNGLKRPACKDEQDFLQKLFKFMKNRNTAIHRVPHLGFKQIDLYFFYTYVQKLGGYDKITCKKLWKHVYDEMGGNPGSTSAATCTRKHYERLLLPFEKHMRGGEHSLLAELGKKPRSRVCKGDDQVTLRLEEENHAVSESVNGDSEDVDASKSSDVDEDVEEVSATSHLDEDSKAEIPQLPESSSSEKEKLPVLKLEKLPFLKERGESIMWRHKVVHQPNVVPNNLIHKDPRWDEIRKQNKLARSWARHFCPPKISSKAMVTVSTSDLRTSSQEQQPVTKHDEPAPSSSQDDCRDPDVLITSSNKPTAGCVHASIPPPTSVVSHDTNTTTVFSTCADRPITATLDIQLNAFGHSPRASDSVSSTHQRHSVCRPLLSGDFPSTVGNGGSVSTTSTIQVAEKYESLFRSRVTNHTLTYPHHAVRQCDYQAQSWLCQRTQQNTSRASCSVVYATMNGDSRAVPKPTPPHLHATGDKRHHLEVGEELEKERKADSCGGQERSASMWRPSVILHTEQMRSRLQSSAPSMAHITHDDKTNNASLSQQLSSKEDKFLQLLNLRPVKREVEATKTCGLPVKGTDLSHESVHCPIKENKAERFQFCPKNIPMISEPLTAKISDYLQHKLQQSAASVKRLQVKHKVECCSSSRNAYSVFQSSPVMPHAQQKKPFRCDISTYSHSHPIGSPHHRFIPLMTTAAKGRSLESKDQAYYDNPKRQRFYNSAMTACSQTQTFPSKPFMQNCTANTNTNTPSIPYHSYDSAGEVLDLSTKKKPQDLGAKTQQTTPTSVADSSLANECLDLSVKKTPDCSGLPSGIENITPPPSLSGDDDLAPIVTGSLTPLGPTKFYSDLVVGTLSENKNCRMISLLDSKFPSSVSQDLSSIDKNSQLPSAVKGVPKNTTDFSSQYSSFLAESHGGASVATRLWTTVISSSHISSSRPTSPLYKDLPNKRESFPSSLYPYLYSGKSFYST